MKILAAERGKFTLLAAFLKAKDEALDANGITYDVIVSQRLTRHRDVMDAFLVVRSAMEALRTDNNHRSAYRDGLKAIRILRNILSHRLGRTWTTQDVKDKPKNDLGPTG